MTRLRANYQEKKRTFWQAYCVVPTDHSEYTKCEKIEKFLNLLEN